MALVNLKLLNALVQKNCLTTAQVSNLKLQVARTGKSEEYILLSNNLVSEKDLIEAKAGVYNIPFMEMDNVVPPPDLLSRISVDVIKEQRAVPFEEDNETIKLVMADPFDIHAIQYWRQKFSPKKIQVFMGIPSKIQEFIDTRLGNVAMTSEVTSALEKVDGGQVKQMAIDLQDTLDSSNISNAPIAKIVNSVLIYATKFGASDIHIEPMEKAIRVRYRIDGVMKEKLTLPKQVQNAVIARIKIMSDMRIDETRLTQDGRIFIAIGNKKFDLRVSTMPSIYGEKVVMRLAERSHGIPPLEHSGLRGIAYKRLTDALKYTNGIILVTGPTGSGKTRTNAGILQKLNVPSVNIITIEDPVEIRVPGVTQVQVNHEIGLDFSNILRSVVRQDPDIILVGEIRDQETAQLAVRAALTGHLVLATLHTNSAAGALPRLIDMGVEPFLVASTIRAVVAQRLVRTLCMSCRQPVVADASTIATITGVLGGLHGFDIIKYLTALSKRQLMSNDPKSIDYVLAPPVKAPEVIEGLANVYLYASSGCNICNNSGFKGRAGIFEVMTMSDSLGQMMMNGRSTEEIQQQAIKEGLITMMQDGYLKALEGITTMEEVLRVANT